MKILYKWENCTVWDNNGTCYFIECPINELTNDILLLMSKEDKDRCLSEEHIGKNNIWASYNPKLANENCVYILVSEKLDKIILEEPLFPYSSQWNAYCPLKEFNKEINNINEIENINL